MNTEKTGGAAFPETKCNTTHEGLLSETWTEGGMTLLDYFAAKAMQGEIGNNSSGIPTRYDDKLNIAVDAYGQAAAMLEIRKKYINQ